MAKTDKLKRDREQSQSPEQDRKLVKTNHHTDEIIITESVSSPIPSTHQALRRVQEQNAQESLNASLTSEPETFTDALTDAPNVFTDSVVPNSDTQEEIVDMLDVNLQPSQPTISNSQFIYVKLDLITELMNKLDKMQNDLTNLKSVNEELVTAVKELKEQRPNEELLKAVKELKGDKSKPNTRKDKDTSKIIEETPSVSHVNDQNMQTLKDKVVPDWGNRFHRRRKHYKKHHSNKEKAAIINEFVNKDEAFVTRKHRPKFAKTEEEYKIKEQMSLTSMATERDVLRMYAESNKENYEKVDSEVYNIICKHQNEAEKDKLLKQWEEEIKRSEEKGRKLNEKSLQFYKSLPEIDPYLGFEGIKKGSSDNDYYYNNNYNHYNSDYYNSGYGKEYYNRGTHKSNNNQNFLKKGYGQKKGQKK